MKKIRSSLSLQLTTGVSILLVIFAFIVSILFSLALRSQVSQHYRDSLLNNAYYIAVNLSENFIYTNSDQTLTQQLLAKESIVEVDIKLYERLTHASIYIVDPAMNILTHQNDTLRLKTNMRLPDQIKNIIDLNLQGKNAFDQYNDNGKPMIVVGSPITNIDGEIIGTVLLDASIQEFSSSNITIFFILIFCLIFALIVVFFITYNFSKTFTKPIKSLQSTAIKLSESDYNARSNISSTNELGQLSAIMDNLAKRLEIAKQNDIDAEKLRRDFLSTISHELKTPVTVIRGYLEAINDDVINMEDTKAIHQQMLKECICLQNLIFELLELTRLQANDFLLDLEDVSIMELLGDVVMSATSLAKKKHITINININNDDIIINGDYQRLRQLLMIILDNAIKYTLCNQNIDIQFADNCITITDHGIGIEDQHLDNIFEKFYRIDNSNKQDSTGLGLSIARQIALRHGIIISVSSQINIGTSFKLDFNKILK